ncbi:MAG: FAD-dependent monooxygenase [Actinomycetota bacterium]|nr:FAD-dependent monooxygenase [Actinomycetota bacterium]
MNVPTTHTDLPTDTTVLIVGAGPAGLAAAVTLAAAGIDHLVLDQQAESANTSRAAVVHARTLEVLDELGVTAELLSRGIVVPRFSIRDGAHTLATIDFGGLPSRFPFTLMVPQDVTEAVLLDKLRGLGGDVLRPFTVVELTAEADGVLVAATDAAGTKHRIRAGYVIGADGMHSVVREQVGIGFTGAAYAESFVLADVRMSWPLPRDEVSLHLSPEGVTVVAPLPGNRFRVVATVAQAPADPDAADIQSVLRSRGPGGAIEVTDVVWSSRFRVHHRLAERYRADRVLLAGDAAHVHSPAGGQGMNTGIQDAVALAGLLTTAIAGGDDTVLDHYQQIRRPIAEAVVSFTDRTTRLATLTSRPARLVRNALLSVVSRVPLVRNKIAYQLAELGNR